MTLRLRDFARTRGLRGHRVLYWGYWIGPLIAVVLALRLRAALVTLTPTLFLLAHREARGAQDLTPA